MQLATPHGKTSTALLELSLQWCQKILSNTGAPLKRGAKSKTVSLRAIIYRSFLQVLKDRRCVSKDLYLTSSRAQTDWSYLALRTESTLRRESYVTLFSVTKDTSNKNLERGRNLGISWIPELYLKKITSIYVWGLGKKMFTSNWIQSGYISYPWLDVSFSHVYKKKGLLYVTILKVYII